MRYPRHYFSLANIMWVVVAFLGNVPVNAYAEVQAGQSLWQALQELDQPEFRLMYSSELVKQDMRVETTPLASDSIEITGEILAPHGLKIIAGPAGRWLVVVADPEPTDTSVTISGRVIDDSGLAIKGSLVRSGDQAVRTSADGSFHIEISLPDEINFEANDHESRLIVIESAPKSALEIRLGPNRLDEIIVIASRYQLFGKGSGIELDQEDIDQLPHLGDDAMRVVQYLPAVSSEDISARFNLRGGTRDETALRLDGLELIDPFHLKDLSGVFSIIDSNLVDSISVLPAGYPAQFGDSASGVVNINSLPPPDESVHSIGISFVNFFANTRGSFTDKRGGWMASIRRGYLDLIIDDQGSEEFSPKYLDAFVTVERDIGDQHTLSLHMLAAHEDLDITDFDRKDSPSELQIDGDSDSMFLWARLRSQWSDKLQSDTVLWHSDSDRTRDNLIDDPFDTSSDLFDQRQINAVGVRSDWGWQYSNSWSFGFGLELEDHSVKYDYSLKSRSNPILYPGHPPISRRTLTTVEGETIGVYAMVRKNFERLSAELGWRVDQESYTGLDENISSPRLALLYELGDDTLIKASWGDYNQFQRAELLQVEDGVEDFFPAIRTEHRVIGFEHRINNDLSMRATAYQKIYHNVLPRYTNLFDPLEVVPEANPDRYLVDASSAEASGIELVMKYRSDSKISWWASYALSRAQDRVDGIDFPREWDQRHAVSGVFNWQGKHWNLNVAGQWHSGWPRTEILIGTVDTPSGPKPGIVPGVRNALNYNNYSRVDVRISRVVQLKRGQLTYYIEAFNLFDKTNECCVDDIGVSPGPELHLDVESWSGIVPSLGLVWSFP